MIKNKNKTSVVSKSSCESAGRFFCDNGLCIDKVLHCDGTNDCDNGVDEQNCRKFSFLSLSFFLICCIYHVQITISFCYSLFINPFVHPLQLPLSRAPAWASSTATHRTSASMPQRSATTCITVRMN